MGHTEDNFVEHTEDNFNKQAELFLSCYAGEQLKVVCLPLRVKDDYELLEILSDGEDVKYFNCILRKKADGKKYLLKVKKLSEHSGLEKEMQQMKRLHAAFPENYQDIIYWIEDERECILRDYQEGCNLEEYAETHSLSVRDILEISEKICNEVSMLHLLKPPVIHRDIKPQNLILDTRGEVHLIDFETARNFDADKKRDTVFFGTELTAAPEQYGYSQTDARTDVYGIGKVMEYLLTGSVEERYTGNDIVKCKIQKMIDCACSFDPANRYANVSLLKKQIVRLKETTFDIRRWKNIIVAVTVVLAIGSVGLVFGIRNISSRRG